jgi:hypothetical protein
MPTPRLDPSAENERLQLLLFEMPDRQEDFLEAAAAEGYHLDYTLATLPELATTRGRWLGAISQRRP